MVPDAILQKTGPLTPQEWELVGQHPELGSRVIGHPSLADVCGWVKAHHERLEGGGYPFGTSGEEIPLEACILAVADAYEAMTCDRPYRAAIGPDRARGELEARAGTQFDGDVVTAFLAALDREAPRSAAVPLRPV